MAAPLLAQSRAITAADYARAERFLAFNTANLVARTGVQPTWLPDGRFTYRVRLPDGSSPLIVVDPAKGTKTDCTAAGANCPAAPAGAIGRPGARPGGRPPEHVSPDGKTAAFIRDWNLWVRDVASNKETQVTTDGVKDFGYATDNAGWVHSDRAILTWSPDSKKLATFQQDQRNVGEMYLVKTKVGHPELSAWKYPLPGDSVVSMIHRVIVDLSAAAPKVVRFKMPADQHRSSVCDHISCGGSQLSDVEWYADGSKLAFLSNSRDHKIATLRIADANTGDVRDVLREEVATQFESGDNGPNWRVLPATNEVIWFSERDDWGQLYLYDLTTGALKSKITTGDGPLLSVERVDEKARLIWFVAAGKIPGRDPYFRHLYRIGMNGKGLTLLTPEDGDHSTTLSPNGAVFVDSWSRADLAPTAVVRNASTGKLISTLEQGDISKLVAAGWKAPTRITVKDRASKWDLYGLMWTPTALDSTKKYPIINYIYPGPQGGSVGSRQFSAATRDNQALAELGFIVVAIEVVSRCVLRTHERQHPARSDRGHETAGRALSVHRSRARWHVGPLGRRIRHGLGDVPVSRLLQGRYFRVGQPRQPQLRRRLGRALSRPTHDDRRRRQLRQGSESDAGQEPQGQADAGARHDGRQRTARQHVAGG